MRNSRWAGSREQVDPAHVVSVQDVTSDVRDRLHLLTILVSRHVSLRLWILYTARVLEAIRYEAN